MIRLLRRFPFTVAMLLSLAVVGVYLRSHVGLLDADVHRRVGFSTGHLLAGQFHRLFGSLLFTAGGWRFYASLGMLTVSVGWAESAFGTVRTMLTFFGAHLATSLILGLVVAIPLTLVGSPWGKLLFYASDVGPSAGYYGCLGLAMTTLSREKRYYVVVVLIVLLVRLGQAAVTLPEQGRALSANLAHLIAFLLAIATASWLRLRQR